MKYENLRKIIVFSLREVKLDNQVSFIGVCGGRHYIHKKVHVCDIFIRKCDIKEH